MQRLLLAIVAALLTVAGVGLHNVDEWNQTGLGAVLIRSGLVLGALALALPQVQRMFMYAPPWFLACCGLGLLLIIRWPRLFLIIVPVLVALWFLGPRTKLPKKTAAPRAKPAAPRKH